MLVSDQGLNTNIINMINKARCIVPVIGVVRLPKKVVRLNNKVIINRIVSVGVSPN